MNNKLLRFVFAFFFVFCLVDGFSGSAQIEDWEDTEIARAKNWVTIEEATGEEEIEILVALRLRNTHQFTSILLDVSDPTSKNYGKHLSQSDVYDLSSPLKEDINIVRNWLIRGNAQSTKILNNGGFVSANFYVKDAITLLSNSQDDPIKFYHYRHQIDTKRTIVRSVDPIFVPHAIKPLVDLIDGVNNFPYLNIKAKNKIFHSHKDTASFGIITGDSAATIEVSLNGTLYSQVQVNVTQGTATQTAFASVGSTPLQIVTLPFTSLANYVPLDVTVMVLEIASGQWVPATTTAMFDVFPSPWITPAVANSLYFIPPGTRATNPGNSQAVAEFDNQFYSPSDLDTFSQLMGVPTPNVTLVGPNNPERPGGESTLDIEWITAIGIDVPTTFWSVKKGFLLVWAIQVSEDANPPLVHSISYGEPEALIRDAELTRLNQEFQLLGMRGISIISTSGDLGSSDGTNICKKDVPDFPSSSPWTTSLGATYISPVTTTSICTGHSVSDIVIVCDATSELPCAQDAGSGFTTGGGFSQKFQRPSYQDAAVQQYLDTAELPSSNYFNSTGRGFNDVAALGYHILTYQGGNIEITGGTSASGPIFAGVLALLNDVQLNQGKSSLGFANVWLYQTAASSPLAFNSVVSGDNKCRETGQECCDEGFVAQPGWNPLTGLGTPVYSLLKDALP